MITTTSPILRFIDNVKNIDDLHYIVVTKLIIMKENIIKDGENDVKYMNVQFEAVVALLNEFKHAMFIMQHVEKIEEYIELFGSEMKKLSHELDTEDYIRKFYHVIKEFKV